MHDHHTQGNYPDLGAVPGVLSIRRQVYLTGLPEMPAVYLQEQSGMAVGPDGRILMLHEVAASEPLACGCHPRSIHDLGVCKESQVLVCRSLHGGDCAVCGAFLCSPYLTVRNSEIDGRRVLVCHRCDDVINTPWWLAALKRLFKGANHG